MPDIVVHPSPWPFTWNKQFAENVNILWREPKCEHKFTHSTINACQLKKQYPVITIAGEYKLSPYFAGMMGMNDVHLLQTRVYRLLSHFRWSHNIQSQHTIHCSLCLSLHGLWLTLHQFVSASRGWDSGTSTATGAECLVDVLCSKRTCFLCASFFEIWPFIFHPHPHFLRHIYFGSQVQAVQLCASPSWIPKSLAGDNIFCIISENIRHLYIINLCVWRSGRGNCCSSLTKENKQSLRKLRWPNCVWQCLSAFKDSGYYVSLMAISWLLQGYLHRAVIDCFFGSHCDNVLHDVSTNKLCVTI